MMIEIIIGIVAIIIVIVVIMTVVSNNKFQLSIIKIDKAEEDIDLYLQKKQELLERTRPVVKKALKSKEFMEDLENKVEGLSNFENHMLLKKCYNELFKVIDENEKLLKSATLLKILEELNDNEENIVGTIKFYNDNVVDYNQLVVAFPSKMIAFFKKYKKKDFYNNEKREIFEILNSK